MANFDFAAAGRRTDTAALRQLGNTPLRRGLSSFAAPRLQNGKDFGRAAAHPNETGVDTIVGAHGVTRPTNDGGCCSAGVDVTNGTDRTNEQCEQRFFWRGCLISMRGVPLNWFRVER